MGQLYEVARRVLSVPILLLSMISGHGMGGLVSKWGSTVTSPGACTVINQYPSRYDLSWCQDVKLQQQTNTQLCLFPRESLPRCFVSSTSSHRSKTKRRILANKSKRKHRIIVAHHLPHPHTHTPHPSQPIDYPKPVMHQVNYLTYIGTHQN